MVIELNWHLKRVQFRPWEEPPHIKHCSAGRGFIKIMKLYLLMAFNCLFFSIALPKVLLKPGRHTQEGDSVNLTCKIIEGFPEPQISWFKDGNPLSKEVNTTLILTNVTVRDEGSYTCKAQNAGGSFTSSIYITVKSKLIKNCHEYTNN